MIHLPTAIHRFLITIEGDANRKSLVKNLDVDIDIGAPPTLLPEWAHTVSKAIT